MSVTAWEPRIVSVLVAEVVGSTSIAEKLGSERSKFLVTWAFRCRTRVTR
jgi:class 3 adenylate cyclase